MIYNLQLLRAFAALSVVYLHVVSDAGLNLNLGAGNFGVDLFFVISGFTIAYIPSTAPSVFILRRCIRIVPMYWVATLGTFLIALCAPTLVQSASADVTHLLHSLFFLPYPNKLGLLQPTLALGWTLNYEMYFYSLFTLALFFSTRLASALTCLFLIALLIAIRAVGSREEWIAFYAEPVVFEFVFGMVTYYVLVGYGRTRIWNSMFLRVLLILTSILAVVALPLQEHFAMGERAIWAGAPAAFLVLSLVILEKRYALAPRQKWVLLLGDSSFVLYLIHPYIIYGIIRLFLDPAKMGGVFLAAAIVGLILLSLATAIALHVIVERPILGFLRNKLSPMSSSMTTHPV